ncbi:MAG: 4-hydroxy-3-methylbut-2-enyl diphosphate reductase [Bacteroidales bacterium]|jgi:4-hydroxy-3-methylbut-2-enyl diphosphate reductase|nr:4-hydroxy-3-methylbut-2-enyl diphosphate reductase [Bacteroidales bacterium]
MKIEIDQNSGFCFGVIHAIEIAEKYLETHQQLFCLGDIVHNNEEVARLAQLGLQIISHQEFTQLHDTTVLIRAHGEPPETYVLAAQNRIKLIDATCPVVLALQKKIRKNVENSDNESLQILIFGKEGHAEVIGLVGQTQNKGIVISSLSDINKIDYTKPAALYSQTTQSLEAYAALIAAIKRQYETRGCAALFHAHDTICRLVANRSQHIREFAIRFDLVLFVSGEKSSNGLYLYELCKQANPNTYFISQLHQLKNLPFACVQSVGICGATSTPLWLMLQVGENIANMATIS